MDTTDQYKKLCKEREDIQAQIEVYRRKQNDLHNRRSELEQAISKVKPLVQYKVTFDVNGEAKEATVWAHSVSSYGNPGSKVAIFCINDPDNYGCLITVGQFENLISFVIIRGTDG